MHQVSFNFVVWRLGLLPSQTGSSNQTHTMHRTRGFGNFGEGRHRTSLLSTNLRLRVWSDSPPDGLALGRSKHLRPRNTSTQETYLARAFPHDKLSGSLNLRKDLIPGHQWCGRPRAAVLHRGYPKGQAEALPHSRHHPCGRCAFVRFGLANVADLADLRKIVGPR